MPRGTLLLLSLVIAGCDTNPPASLSRGEELFETCAPCHGDDGGGNADLKVPAIAGMQQWYIETQLHNFKDGVRGYLADDEPGLRMRPMARSLETEEDLTSVAQYVAGMTPVTAAGTLSGDSARGKNSFAVCTACHGADGKGNESLGAPALAGKDDWYLVTQLHNFKNGLRGAHKDDTRGGQMRPMAAGLDEQAMLDVVAYIKTL